MEHEILDDQFDGTLNTKGSHDVETIKLINKNKVQINQATQKIKNARIAIIAYAVIILFFILYNYSKNLVQIEGLVEGVVLSLIFAACALAIKFNPKVALLSALVIYVLYWILYIFVDVSYIYAGLVYKGIMLYYLILGVDGAFKFTEKMKTLVKLGLPDEELDQAKLLNRLPPTSLIEKNKT